MEWFVRNFVNGIERKKVLDVGSYDVNGCYRNLFAEDRFEYIGLDMEAGPNVDLVPRHPYNWSELENDTFDISISGQALEHIEFFWVTVAEMVRVTKKGGLICIIAPNGFEEHRYPVDCWRFFTDGMAALARYTSLEILHAHTNCAPSSKDREWFSYDCADAMLIARKPYEGAAILVDTSQYTCKPADHLELRQELISHAEASALEKETGEECTSNTTNENSAQISSLRTKIKQIAKAIIKTFFPKRGLRKT